MSAGDGHIWKIGKGTIPEAECGYTPKVVEIKNDAGEVVYTEIRHAKPTGTPCVKCNEIVTPFEPVEE